MSSVKEFLSISLYSIFDILSSSKSFKLKELHINLSIFFNIFSSKINIFLFKLLENYLVNKIDDLNKNGIKLKIIGDRNIFSKKLKKILNNSEKITNKNNKLQVNLALNYGAKKELVSAFNILKKNKQKITEKSISNNLFTNSIPDPEILIRTGNTHRLSNFLLWQIAYSEIFFIKKLWPDFNTNDFKQIINKFKNIKRNFGSIK